MKRKPCQPDLDEGNVILGNNILAMINSVLNEMCWVEPVEGWFCDKEPAWETYYVTTA